MTGQLVHPLFIETHLAVHLLELDVAFLKVGVVMALDEDFFGGGNSQAVLGLALALLSELVA